MDSEEIHKQIDVKCYWTNVTKRDRHPQGCWTWVGRYRGPTGVVTRLDKSSRHDYVMAHRVAWALHVGSDVDSVGRVLQTCGNRLCVNPEHLVPMPKQYSQKPRLRLSEGELLDIQELCSRGTTPAQAAHRYVMTEDEVLLVLKAKNDTEVKACLNKLRCNNEPVRRKAK